MQRGKALLLIVVALLALVATPLAASAAPREGKLLRNMRVTGALEDGGSFKGRLTITEFGYDETEGLTVSGTIQGVATTADGASRGLRQSFSDVPTTLSTTSNSGGMIAAQQASCDILFLDLGPLFLDLLGLTVDLSPIELDIDAVPGAGNLLGNLLCAVVGLLDPVTGLIQFLQNLGQLLELINQINDLLG
jgi:hypothetical protein